MKYTLLCKVKEGKLSNAKKIRQIVESFEGKTIELIISKASKKRSSPQNRYYWGCIVPIIKEALLQSGNIFNDEHVHDLLKFKFLKEDLPFGTDGEFITRIKSTAELTTSQFMDYIAQIQQWAAEFLSIDIPDPNEQIELEV